MDQIHYYKFVFCKNVCHKYYKHHPIITRILVKFPNSNIPNIIEVEELELETLSIDLIFFLSLSNIIIMIITMICYYYYFFNLAKYYTIHLWIVWPCSIVFYFYLSFSSFFLNKSYTRCYYVYVWFNILFVFVEKICNLHKLSQKMFHPSDNS